MEKHNIKPQVDGVETAAGVKIYDFACSGNAFINLQKRGSVRRVLNDWDPKKKSMLDSLDVNRL